MKANKNGQGVIDGVETDKETDNRKFEEEKRAFSNIHADTMRLLTETVSIISDKGTYRANLILQMALATLQGINEIGHKAGQTGTVKITVRPEMDKCKVTASYNNMLFDKRRNKSIGVTTHKPVLLDKTDVFQPVHCENYDDLIMKGASE